jgi:glutamate synthase domain-containing protein 2
MEVRLATLNDIEHFCHLFTEFFAYNAVLQPEYCFAAIECGTYPEAVIKDEKADIYFKRKGVLSMKYQCTICNYEFDESQAARENDQISCPICNAPQALLTELRSEEKEPAKQVLNPLAYPANFARRDDSIRYMAEIHQMAVTGKSIIEAMGIKKVVPNWDDILILGAQLDPMPLESHEEVATETVIGKHAKKPLVIKNPVYISHMSQCTLSREAKIALAKGSAMAKTAMCSGDDGILQEEMEASYKYIFEYAPNLYSATIENLKMADAIEIKIGQSTIPGLGGMIPGEKVTKELAAVHGKQTGEDIYDPSKFKDINSKDDLKRLVDKLRTESAGRPIGIKIAAGRIERDLAFCVYAEPDFVTIDGRGGATGASPKLVRDTASVPTVFALHRARKYLDSVQSDISLIITGGLRVSSDFAKAIAMGADAIAIATAGLMAMACQQYRICGTGQCPVGIATQVPGLRLRLEVDAAAQRVANFLNVSLFELQNFARLTGHRSIHDLNVDDLCTINREISDFTNIGHV